MCIEADKPEFSHRYRSCLALYFYPLSCQVIKPDAVFLHRGIHRRHLHDIPAELRNYRLNILSRKAALNLAEHPPGDIERIGRHSEPEIGIIFFIGIRQQRLCLSRISHKYRQYPRSHRVKRSAVPYLFFTEYPADYRHDVKGGKGRLFVYDKYPVHASPPILSAQAAIIAFFAFSGESA